MLASAWWVHNHPCPPTQDFIPPEELAKLMSKAGDKAAAEAVEAKTAIGAC
jgi:hypothetical protein